MFSPADWLAAAARRVPDRDALVVNGASFTFRELDRAASGLARRLTAMGVGAGDRVGTLLSNGLAASVLPHATLRLGATLVPFNTRLTHAELEWQVGHSRVVLVIGKADGVQNVARNLKFGSIDENDLRILHSIRNDELAPSHPVAQDPLAIIYTSGTTGRPKGAVLTVGNFAASAAASAATLGVHDDDRWLAVLPFFHVGGLSILLRCVMQGTCVVVHEHFDAAAANRAIDDEGVTIVSLVAVMLERLLDARGDRPFPKNLRCALVGGGPLPRSLIDRCHRVGVPVAPTYGLTEATSQVATLLPAQAPVHVGSVGRALPGTAVRIAGSTEGEILVRGPTVMAGYLDDPVATATAIRDGWLHTGDIGRLDDDGFLHVLDRRDDLIVTGGENVYPAEVESVLSTHPAIDEAGVMGEPDERWGQRVVAVVRLRDDVQRVDADSITAFCRERLAGYKVPRAVRLVSAPLPRTASGKLQRSRLRDLQ